MKQKSYIAERISNICELEDMIRSQAVMVQLLENEMKNSAPDLNVIRPISSRLIDISKQLSNFEFRMERRQEIYSD